MQEIKCPNCGEVFVVDESGYAQIVQQVRDKEFDKELRRREEELAGKQESELRLLKLEQKQEYDAALAKKETEIQKLDRLIADLFSLNRARADADVVLSSTGTRSLACFGRVMLPHRLAVPQL